MRDCPSQKLAILDWGIGGMGFYRLWRRRRPDVPVLYWSDTGATPYGKLPADALRERVAAVCRALRQRGARQVAVACNAASTVVGDLPVGLNVDGIIGHAVEAACEAVEERVEAKRARIGVLGGRRTIESGLYQQAFDKRGLEVDGRVAQPLSALVERGVLAGPEVEETLAPILDGLGTADAVLLACTHYPALREPIAARLPGLAIIDPVERFVAAMDARWPARSGDDTGGDRDGEREGGDDTFLTTGAADAMSTSAQAGFGVELPSVTEVEI